MELSWVKPLELWKATLPWAKPGLMLVTVKSAIVVLPFKFAAALNVALPLKVELPVTVSWFKSAVAISAVAAEMLPTPKLLPPAKLLPGLG